MELRVCFQSSVHRIIVKTETLQAASTTSLYAKTFNNNNSLNPGLGDPALESPNNQLSETESLFMISMDIPVSPPLQVTHQHQQQQHQHTQNIMQQHYASQEDKEGSKSIVFFRRCISKHLISKYSSQLDINLELYEFL